jgi:hypothetical protein
MKHFLLFISFLLFSSASFAADKEITVKVKNNLSFARAEEIVEVSKSKIFAKLGNPSSVVVTDANNNEIPSQITYDGKLIFQVSVPAKGSSKYIIKEGTPEKYDAKVHGRQFPERVDDVAWENDRIAFRTYGPALQRNNERAFGYDVWNKRTDKLVIEDRYALETDKEIRNTCSRLKKAGYGDLSTAVYYAISSYHTDHGTGQDCYKVGPTLGCGTAALLENNGKDIVYPYCYKDYEILDKGPLRFTVKLVYNPEKVNGKEVTETRIISLDAGTNLNKATVSYSGLASANPVVAGIVIHEENPTAFVLNSKGGYMAYEDLGDSKQYQEAFREKYNKDFGKIFTGAVFTGATQMKYQEFTNEDKPNRGGALGHILATSSIKPNSSFTYYFGSGWNRNPNTGFTSLKDWEAYLDKAAKKLKNPLVASF